MRRIFALFFVFLSGLGAAVYAQGTSIVSQTLQSTTANNTAYLIATLPASTGSTYDHLHLVATLDNSYSSSQNTKVDLIAGNASTFSVAYTAMGYSPASNTTRIVAYQQGSSGTAVNLYILLPKTNATATYAVLENIAESAPATLTAINIDANPLSGTLIFDTGSTSYPPKIWRIFLGISTFHPAV